MNYKTEPPLPVEASIPTPRGQAPRLSSKRRLVFLGIFSVLVCLLFLTPLKDWVHMALNKERNSYLLMVPLISAYLVWIKRREISCDFKTSMVPAFLFLLIGAGALVAAFSGGGGIEPLSLAGLAMLSFMLAGAFSFIGASVMRQITFPLAFLAFAIPMPTLISDGIETFLQYASADAAHAMLRLSNVPMLRMGLDFRFPGVGLRVAQECSGYNSSFALFMVSTLAGYLFLKSPWRKTILAAIVIPLAIIRNGFRITTIALLCVYVDPKMIDSYIHREGGPIFFALSLIPFLLLLWWLRKSEIVKSRNKTVSNS